MMAFGFLQRDQDLPDYDPIRPPDRRRSTGSDPEALPLSALRRGQVARLLHVDAELPQARRLAELGLIPGARLTVIQNGNGPVLVAIHETRVALGQRMARRLDVELI